MDQFTKDRILTEGTFGTTLLVRHKSTGVPYVIKQLPTSRMTRKEKDESLREVKLLSKLHHPNIVAWKRTFEHSGNLCILMEYCENGDLSVKVKKHFQKSLYFTEDDILEWFTQICLAIKYIHDKHILHRDIKLQNIFLTRANVIKLGDFGISIILQNTDDLAKTCIGTPFYLSPEICENRPYNQKSDIWSLGCVLYELATLRHPFIANNVKSLVLKIIRGNYPPVPPKYSPEFRQLINLILRKNPKDRLNINEILNYSIISKQVTHLLSNSNFLSSRLLYKSTSSEDEPDDCRRRTKLPPIHLKPTKFKFESKSKLTKSTSVDQIPLLSTPKKLDCVVFHYLFTQQKFSNKTLDLTRILDKSLFDVDQCQRKANYIKRLYFIVSNLKINNLNSVSQKPSSRSKWDKQIDFSYLNHCDLATTGSQMEQTTCAPHDIISFPQIVDLPKVLNNSVSGSEPNRVVSLPIINNLSVKIVNSGPSSNVNVGGLSRIPRPVIQPRVLLLSPIEGSNRRGWSDFKSDSSDDGDDTDDVFSINKLDLSKTHVISKSGNHSNSQTTCDATSNDEDDDDKEDKLLWDIEKCRAELERVLGINLFLKAGNCVQTSKADWFTGVGKDDTLRRIYVDVWNKCQDEYTKKVTCDQRRDLTVWWFKDEFSQSRLAHRTKASNACTIIAILIAYKTYASKFNFGCLLPTAMCPQLVFIIAEGIIEGNNLYDRLHDAGELADINLTVPEALKACEHMGGAIKEWRSYVYSNNMSCYLFHELSSMIIDWFRNPPKRCVSDLFVILITESRSVLIVIQRVSDTVSLIDSHQHVPYGAVVAQVPSKNLDQLCRWYSDTLRELYGLNPRVYELSLLYVRHPPIRDRSLSLERIFTLKPVTKAKRK